MPSDIGDFEPAIPLGTDGSSAVNPQVYVGNDAGGIAPRHGRLALDDGRWIDLELARRWAAVPQSFYFGTALYLSRTGKWVYFTPGTLLNAPAVVEVTAEDALAYLIREGLEVPPALAAVRTTQEV